MSKLYPLMNSFDPFSRDMSGVFDAMDLFFPSSYKSSKQKSSGILANIKKLEDKYALELSAPGFSRDDFSLNVDSIYIPRINMQHEELVKLDSTLFYNNRMYSDFYHQLGHTIERDLKRRLNNNE